MTPAAIPLSWPAAVTAWTFQPVSDAAILVAAMLYLRTAGMSPGWPHRRTACFLGGLTVLVLTLNGVVGAYAHVLFSMHMAQHLLLITVIPALIVLGQPLELLRRTSPPRRRGDCRHCAATASWPCRSTRWSRWRSTPPSSSAPI